MTHDATDRRWEVRAIFPEGTRTLATGITHDQAAETIDAIKQELLNAAGPVFWTEPARIIRLDDVKVVEARHRNHD